MMRQFQKSKDSLFRVPFRQLSSPYGKSYDNMKKEKYDSDQETLEKVKKMAELMDKIKAQGQHSLCFTGAGLSTSAGIPDYRSGKDTKISTGPGAYELSDEERKKRGAKVRDHVIRSVPTQSHMAIRALFDSGYFSGVVSQNTDGLHLKSGIPVSALMELHGNSQIENCPNCGTKYARDFRTRVKEDPFSHGTGRHCLTCPDQELQDDIINFGEAMNQQVMQQAYDYATKARFQLCLGSSLLVQPANQIPIQTLRSKGVIGIVNIQQTPLDQVATFRLHSMIDFVMINLCKNLDIAIPKFTIKRRIRVMQEEGAIRIEGTDVHGRQISFIKQVEIQDAKQKQFISVEQEPFIIQNSLLSSEKEGDPEEVVLDFRVVFYSHYNEPSHDVEVRRKDLIGPKKQMQVDIEYDLELGRWERITGI